MALREPRRCNRTIYLTSVYLAITTRDPTDCIRSKSRHRRQQHQTLHRAHSPTQHVLTQRSTSAMRYQYDPCFLLRLDSFLFQLLGRFDASHEILAYRMPPGEVHAPETRIPAAAMTTIADSIAWISVTREKGEVGEPDRGTAEAAVGEEEWRF